MLSRWFNLASQDAVRQAARETSTNLSHSPFGTSTRRTSVQASTRLQANANPKPCRPPLFRQPLHTNNHWRLLLLPDDLRGQPISSACCLHLVLPVETSAPPDYDSCD